MLNYYQVLGIQKGNGVRTRESQRRTFNTVTTHISLIVSVLLMSVDIIKRMLAIFQREAGEDGHISEGACYIFIVFHLFLYRTIMNFIAILMPDNPCIV